MRPNVILYTDGACQGNPGPGGWACILLSGGKELSLGGGEPMTTNNRMELLGVINGLKRLGETLCDVQIFSDSQYVVNAISKGWLKGWKQNGWCRKDGELKNADLWQQLDGLLAKHRCSFTWIKGHNGDKYNEMCDSLAVKAAAGYSFPPVKKEENLFPGELPGQESFGSLGENAGIESADVVISALQEVLVSFHNLQDGMDTPCGLYKYCRFCKESPYRCASAYLTERASRQIG